MKPDLPVWRSLLYVPVNVEKFVEKAHTRGADVLQLDLEDAVPPAEKANARKLVEKNAARVRRGGADVVVRINQPLSLAVRDIEASICPDVDGIAITKADSGSHVKLLDQLVSELELKRGMKVGHTKFLTMIETADAFSRIDEIPRASPRTVGMLIGGEDFALDLNAQPDDDVLLHPKQRMIIAARSAAGILLNHVPFKGSPDAHANLFSGQIPVMFDAIPAVLPHVKAGRLRALGIGSAQRSPFLPEVPTIAESGFPGFEAVGWIGIAAPAKTSPAVLDKLQAEIVRIINTSEMKERLATLAFTPVGDSRAEFARFIKSEIAKWGKAVKESGAKAD
jgi:hypothetical protein